MIRKCDRCGDIATTIIKCQMKYAISEYIQCDTCAKHLINRLQDIQATATGLPQRLEVEHL